MLIDRRNIGSLFANVITGNKTIGLCGDGLQRHRNAADSGKSGAINIRADGYLEALNIKARGDVQATTLKANTVMVETAHIGGNAVTIPVSAEGVFIKLGWF